MGICYAIKQKADLKEFLENDIGCRIMSYGDGFSAKLNCPMPWHKDNNASFFIKYLEEDGFWIYHCFGCEAKGTIVEFFKDYYNIYEINEVIDKLKERFEVSDEDSKPSEKYKNMKKKVDNKKKIEYQHILSSNQCRMLLRQNYENNKSWVAKSYKKMNIALETSDIGIIEEVGRKAFKRYVDKGI